MKPIEERYRDPLSYNILSPVTGDHNALLSVVKYRDAAETLSEKLFENLRKYQPVLPIKPPGCIDTMQYFISAGLYQFYECSNCVIEMAIWINDKMLIRDSLREATRPETPPVFPGNISGDRGGRVNGKETKS